jgi:predicted ATP-binding protein involved in virulence
VDDFTKLPAVCLIDEIDTYLHPKWQYSILDALVKAFPNVQFIVTTHSPYVVGSIPNDKIQLFICEQPGLEAQVKPKRKLKIKIW